MFPLTTPQYVTDLGEGIYGFRAIAEIADRLVSTGETIFFVPLVNLVLIHDSPIFKFFWVCCLSIFRKPHTASQTCAMRGAVSPLNLVQSSQARTKGPWGPLIIVRMIFLIAGHGSTLDIQLTRCLKTLRLNIIFVFFCGPN